MASYNGVEKGCIEYHECLESSERITETSEVGVCSSLLCVACGI
jgi:hypothetical protein